MQIIQTNIVNDIISKAESSDMGSCNKAILITMKFFVHQD